ncbi:MAG: glucose-6-phosphate dehydrogenase [Patescibacteria group bacterium]
MIPHQLTQIVILGGTGDLAQKKLLPALFDLFLKQKLPTQFQIIGIARSNKTHEEYQKFVADLLQKNRPVSENEHTKLNEFCANVFYLAGSFDTPETFENIQNMLGSMDGDAPANRLFYLAVPPEQYGNIFKHLHDSGVTTMVSGETWARILVEKPFGKDIHTAQALEQELSSRYKEEQIFRIDHYLAKEAVQNILSFRFANMLLRSPWNKDHIASVDITMFETIDVGARSGFYEGVGALRDVGQNHLLQLLALIAMDEPENFSAESIRTKRIQVLNALRPLPTENLTTHILRAQYDGYREDKNIPNDSQTETYFELKVFVDKPEWRDVPFFIRAGKALSTSEVSITIHLKDIATGLFLTEQCTTVGNVIKLTISPTQAISILLNAKAPGLGFGLETRELALTCPIGDTEIKNSYEKVLYDAIVGDQTLFTTTEEVLAAWKFITPILEHWQTVPLHTYIKGSSGPLTHIA